MAYAVQADIENAIGLQKLVDISDFDDNGTVDAASVTRALDEATSLVDTFLSAYLPITTVPEVLRRAVVDIAIHRLRVGRDNTTGDSRLAYQQALDWLAAVAKGNASLPSTGSASSVLVSAPVLEAEDRLMTRSTLGIL